MKPSRPRTPARCLVRLALWGTLLLLALGAGAIAFALSERSRLHAAYPPPGGLYDVGGYRLHLHCVGQGSPTMVLEAGLNDFSVVWTPVQGALAQGHRVCAYDRAGLGWSEPSPRPRTATVMVDELRRLLQGAGVEGPYLLVGHSYGGVLMRLYAQLYPQEVSGLVLVDSAHEEQALRVPAFDAAVEQALAQFRLWHRVGGLGGLALAPDRIPTRGLHPSQWEAYRAVLAARPYFAGALAETEHFLASLAEARDYAASLGALPLTVISRGRGEALPGMSPAAAERYEGEWQRMQRELSRHAVDSAHLIAAHSGHYVQLENPRLVVEAVRQLARRIEAAAGDPPPEPVEP